MDRSQFMQELDQRWQELLNACDGLSAEDYTLPESIGLWSLKGLFAHISTWEIECLHYLPGIAAGEKQPDYKQLHGGIDAFNAAAQRRNKDLPLADIQSRLLATHLDLLSFLASVEDATFFEENFFRRLNIDTYYHYPEHTEAILAWRQASGR